AVAARLIARRRHDTPPVRVASHDNGFPPQRRIAVELHRREEGVQVEVRDHECNLARSGARSGRGRRPPAGRLRVVLTHDADELAALQTSFYLLEGQFAYAEPLRLALQNLALGRAWPGTDPGPKTAPVELLAPLYTDEIAARLAKLEQAISKQRTVRFRYWTITSDSEAERTVNPYGLWEMNGVWYVVGDDLERDDEDGRRRTFRVSRIRGEIKFATRRERDFRIPADFNV